MYNSRLPSYDLGAATGSHALIFDFVLHVVSSHHHVSKASKKENHSRAIGLVRSPPHREVWPRVRRLEKPRARLDQLVLGRRLVHHVAGPRVPARVDLAGVVVVLGELNPARAQGELLWVLEELVAGAIGADEAAVFGVAWGVLVVWRWR